MNSTERLIKALNLEPVDRVPVTGLLTSVTVELMNSVGVFWPEAHSKSELMVELAAAAYKLCGLESLKIPFDMTVEAEAMGGKVHYGNGMTLPQISGHLYNDPDDLKSGREFLDKGRVPIVLKAINMAQKKYNKIIPVVSSIVGPFSLAAKLFGFNDFFTWIILDQGKLEKCLEKATDICIMYAKEQVAAGSDVVLIGEAACSGDLISPESYKSFILPFHRRLCESIEIPSVIHICGNITGHLKYLADTKASGISFDEKTNIESAIDVLKGKIALVGYLSAIDIMLKSTPEEVYMKSIECIKNGVDVLNAGCAWPPMVGMENIKAMVKAAKGS